MMMTKTALRGVTVPSLRNIGHLDDNAAEIEPAGREMAEDTDLLDLVPQDRVADLRSTGQTELMAKLVNEIAELDGEAGHQARTYTDGMTERGLWTPGREGNASAWISRMIAKVRELKASATREPEAPSDSEIPAGRYAVTTDEVRCYSIDYGKPGTRWDGFLFLSRISSDDLYAIKNPAEKARILAAISADVEASAILAGLTLRQCRRCGRTLSDTKNPFFSVALGPECGQR